LFVKGNCKCQFILRLVVPLINFSYLRLCEQINDDDDDDDDDEHSQTGHVVHSLACFIRRQFHFRF